MKTGIARIVLFAFAILSVAMILWLWKSQDRERALLELETEYQVEFTNFNGEEVHVKAASPKVTDLNKVAELIERAEKLMDGTPLVPRVLDISGNSSIKTLRGVSRFRSLRSLIATECPALTDASGISGLPDLTELMLSYNPALADVSEIRHLPSLVTVDLTNARSLQALNFENVPSLGNLYLTGCRNLASIDVSNYQNLKQLYLDGCMLIDEIQGLNRLDQLTDLDVSNCQGLKILDGLENLKSLVVLDMRNVELPDFSIIAKLPNLEVLRLEGQGNITSLEAFTQLPKLREFYIESCPNLTSLVGIPPNLGNYIGVIRCHKLASLTGLGAAKNLQHVDLNSCDALTDISELNSLPDLTRVSLLHCRKIRDVKCLERNNKLSIVQLGNTGVVAADIEELQKTLTDTVFDFSIPE